MHGRSDTSLQTQDAPPRLVPLLSRRNRRILSAAIVAWLAAAVFFWLWWLEPGHRTTTAGLVVNTVVLAFEFGLVPAWFLFFARRMRRPRPDAAVPRLRTAMVVTKAPSEPWHVVRETVEAMLAQAFPRAYDVWLADEDPTSEVEAWCREHGVRISTRRDAPEYHRDTWPRRKRCKEGNLAYFYDHYGYRMYDVVVQLDADHVPAPTYLRHMVAPFADPRIGYVAAPSICDRNAAGSWSARGRLYVEATIHGPAQAGYNDGWAPSCIGSHYAVRTGALQDVGGLGPELAEDFSTTFMLSSQGWEGAFAIDAEAHGDGPQTVEDCVTQDLQWSRSMMNLLLGLGWKRFAALSWRAKVKLGFCLLWYPASAAVLLVAHALPIWALVGEQPLVDVGLGAFVLHLAPGMAILIAVTAWLRRYGWLRPSGAPVVSWESMLFQLVRWPWVLIGCVQALAGRVARREYAWKVTPKGADRSRRLSPVVLAPSLAITVASILPALLVDDPGAARGYYFWSLLNAVLYLLVAVALVVLHSRENPRPHTRRRPLLAWRADAVAVALAAVLVVPAIALHGTEAVAAVSYRDPLGPWPFRDVHGPVLGVTTDALARNVERRWLRSDLAAVDGFEHGVRGRAGIVMWFEDWAHGAPSRRQLDAVAARGSVPEITWEPWNHERGIRRAQPRYRLRSIIEGRHDRYLREWAEVVSRHDGPVRVRLAQEMNHDAYPWSEQHNGNHRGEFVRAWRHVHDVVERAGARNIVWVWSPLAGKGAERYYPGDRYVDVVGLSGFNGGTRLRWSGWRSFRSIFRSSLARLEEIAPGKPIEISEVSSVDDGGSKAQWIRGMFAELRRQDRVEAVVWFNLRKEADWRVDSSPAALRAFVDGLERWRETP